VCPRLALRGAAEEPAAAPAGVCACRQQGEKFGDSSDPMATEDGVAWVKGLDATEVGVSSGAAVDSVVVEPDLWSCLLWFFADVAIWSRKAGELQLFPRL
jgi:hypothetical protein